jgi:hypothetical protein
VPAVEEDDAQAAGDRDVAIGLELVDCEPLDATGQNREAICVDDRVDPERISYGVDGSADPSSPAGLAS